MTLMDRIQNDAPFLALEAIAADAEPPISQALMLDLYTIQREHQFDKDRRVAIQRMQERILAEIDQDALMSQEAGS
jgi:hypothetical protein